MFIYKNFSFTGYMRFAGHHLIWLTLWMAVPVVIHYFWGIDFILIPFISVSLVGTAVAFYVGFKNNQSYDRLWEARKIWGAIVNSSRSWGTMAKNFPTNDFGANVSDEELEKTKNLLVRRHIAWLYQLRKQLLVATPWEHIALNNRFMRRFARRRRQVFGLGLVEDQEFDHLMKTCLRSTSLEKVEQSSNGATTIIDLQTETLAELRRKNIINDFRHMEMQKMLTDFYTQQGKCERIKKFPFPRQYANMSNLFIAIFVFLLPLGTIGEFEKLGDWGIWVSIVANVIVSWTFIVMELVGDYSENPFEGMGNDIPMLSLCRTIEIDLLEMINASEIPEPIKPVRGVLM